MESNTMKNIVVLKDLPSNIVKEAFVILKDNESIKIEDYVLNNKKEIEMKKQSNENNRDYIVKEAELLISEYLTNIEKKNIEQKEQEDCKLKLKYRRLKFINVFLFIISSIIVLKNII